MTSAGGLVGSGEAARLPAALLLSGPAGGVRAGAAVAVACGYPDAVTFDMGGTSTDVCLVRGGVPEPAPGREVAGFPVRLPALDIHTIGAGGGSIARLDPGGALAVGPESAGAEPGPACYGRGGTAPTVTDADLVLGRIPADAAFPGLGRLDLDASSRALRHALGGSRRGTVRPVRPVPLCRAGRRRAGRRRWAGRPPSSPPVSWRWSTRPWSRRCGPSPSSGAIDPAGLALVAFGGAGPLHACALAEALGMAAVIVPPRAGAFSAVGLLCSPRQRELVRSWPDPVVPGRARRRSRRARGRGPGGGGRHRCRYSGERRCRCRRRHRRRVRPRLPLPGPEPRAERAVGRGVPRRAPAAQRLRPSGRAGGGGGPAGPGPASCAAGPGRPAGGRSGSAAPARRWPPSPTAPSGSPKAGPAEPGPLGAWILTRTAGAGRNRLRSGPGTGPPSQPVALRAPAAGPMAHRSRAARPGGAAHPHRPAHRHRRRDGGGAPAGGVLAQHQGAGRLLGGAVHPRRRAAGPGRAHPRPPRFDAGLGAGGHRRLRQRGAAPATRSCSTTPSPAGPTSTTSRSSPPASPPTAASSAGPPTGPTTPTSAGWRRARSRPRPPRCTRRACGSRPSSSPPRCEAVLFANSRTRRRAARRPRRPAGRQPGRRRAVGAAGRRAAGRGRRLRRAPHAGRAGRACPTAPGASRTCSTPPAPGPSTAVRPASSSRSPSPARPPPSTSPAPTPSGPATSTRSRR